ncbi:unnamed protein product, partial [Brachionus calyciflorus]
GRKNLSSFYIESIEKHMQSISSIAANRYLKKCETNAFYSSVSFLQAYSSFLNKNEISFSSFYKYLSDKYKKPHRLSDLCDYCEINKLYMSEVLSLAFQNGYENDQEKNFNSMRDYLSNFYSNEEFQSIRDTVQYINQLDFHKTVASRQREAYNQMKNNLESDYILIEIDWKQKILIGMSPRQTSLEYRNQKTRTLLGFGIYFKEENLTESINIDLVSSFNENESALDVINGFSSMRIKFSFNL